MEAIIQTVKMPVDTLVRDIVLWAYQFPLGKTSRYTTTEADCVLLAGLKGRLWDGVALWFSSELSYPALDLLLRECGLRLRVIVIYDGKWHPDYSSLILRPGPSFGFIVAVPETNSGEPPTAGSWLPAEFAGTISIQEMGKRLSEFVTK